MTHPAQAPVPASQTVHPMPYFSPIRREGEWAFVSGQMAFDAQMRLKGGNVAEQTRVCLSRPHLMTE